MRRQLVFGTMLAAALAVGVSAQEPSQERPRAQGQSDRTVTVTGCLQTADGSGSAQPSTGDTTSKQQSGQAAQFILADASTTGSGTATRGGTSGTGTSGTATGTGTTGSTPGAAGAASSLSYRLIGGEKQNLKQYVNSRVEITGTLQPATDRRGTGAGTGTGTGTGTSGSATGTGAPGSGSMAGRTGSDQANMQALRVTSVRQISGSCSGQ